MVYAADDQPSYNKWMKILRKKLGKTVTIAEEIPEEQAKEREDSTIASAPSHITPVRPIVQSFERERASISVADTMSKLSEHSLDYQHVEEEIVDPQEATRVFFEQHPMPKIKDFASLFPRMSPQLIVPRLLALMQHELQLDTDDVVTHGEFAEWWNSHLHILSGALDSSIELPAPSLRTASVIAPPSSQLFGLMGLDHREATGNIRFDPEFLRIPALYKVAFLVE